MYEANTLVPYRNQTLEDTVYLEWLTGSMGTLYYILYECLVCPHTSGRKNDEWCSCANRAKISLLGQKITMWCIKIAPQLT